jgi:hypothetical protein
MCVWHQDLKIFGTQIPHKGHGKTRCQEHMPGSNGDSPTTENWQWMIHVSHAWRFKLSSWARMPINSWQDDVIWQDRTTNTFSDPYSRHPWPGDWMPRWHHDFYGTSSFFKKNKWSFSLYWYRVNYIGIDDDTIFMRSPPTSHNWDVRPSLKSIWYRERHISG